MKTCKEKNCGNVFYTTSKFSVLLCPSCHEKKHGRRGKKPSYLTDSQKKKYLKRMVHRCKERLEHED